MRLYEISKRSLRGSFVHETTVNKAKQIAQNGFEMRNVGIFFNRVGNSYSGGGYGGALVSVVLDISALLDLSNDDDYPDDLDEFADAEEIAAYARSHGFQAWADDLQLVVLDLSTIKDVTVK